MPLWLEILDGLLWLFVLGGLLRLAWQHRGEFDFREANAPGDPSCYVGLFYNNPDDPRLLVPRRPGLIGPIQFGWTLNVAHPHARRAVAGIVAIVLASALLGALVRH